MVAFPIFTDLSADATLGKIVHIRLKAIMDVLIDSSKLFGGDYFPNPLANLVIYPGNRGIAVFKELYPVVRIINFT